MRDPSASQSEYPWVGVNTGIMITAKGWAVIVEYTERNDTLQPALVTKQIGENNGKYMIFIAQGTWPTVTLSYGRLILFPGQSQICAYDSQSSHQGIPGILTPVEVITTYAALAM